MPGDCTNEESLAHEVSKIIKTQNMRNGTTLNTFVDSRKAKRIAATVGARPRKLTKMTQAQLSADRQAALASLGVTINPNRRRGNLDMENNP